MVANTGDNADGQVLWWINGVKAGEYTDVKFGTATQSDVWEEIAWRPVWGCTGDSVTVPGVYMRMDHQYASGAMGGPASNEPPGFTAFTNRPFDARAELGWSWANRDVVDRFDIVTDATAPESPQNVGRITFPAGWPGGEAPALTFREDASLPYTQLYSSFG